MTDEQIKTAAQRHADNIKLPAKVPGALTDLMVDIATAAYVLGAEEAVALQWVDPRERLPEDRQRIVLCYQSYYEGRYLSVYDVERYNADEGFGYGTVDTKRVMAWMPLPEIKLPKGAEK